MKILSPLILLSIILIIGLIIGFLLIDTTPAQQNIIKTISYDKLSR